MTRAEQRRVIINTDAKNEADDQFAIVHALLSPTLDIRGLIAAHFGTSRSSPQHGGLPRGDRPAARPAGPVRQGDRCQRRDRPAWSTSRLRRTPPAPG